MKKKYHGIASLVIGIIAIGGMVGYGAHGAWQIPAQRSSNRLSPAALSRIKVPSAEQISKMDHLYGRLAQLARPASRSVAIRPLTLFGSQADTHANAGNADGETDTPAGSNQRLTLTVLAGLFRYCIMDAEFLAEGAVTPAGGRIMKIEAQRILVAQGQERKWVYLKDDQAVSDATSKLMKAIPEKGPS